MMATLAWRFPYERIEHSKVFPDEFLCIASELRVDLEALPQSQIWMIAEMGSEGEYLYGHIVAESVGVIEEGLNRGSIILRSNRSSSFRILPHDRALHQRCKLGAASDAVGLWPMEAPILDRCQEIVRRNDVRSYSPPSAGKFAIVAAPANLAPRAFARETFWNALAHFALGDLERWASDKALSPFAVLAAQKCRMAGLPGEAVEEIERLDRALETILGAGVGHSEPTASTAESSPLGVDTRLTGIDPLTITARRFLAAEKPSPESNRLAKTQEAESRHQEILRDVAAFLVGRGMKPLQSRSIDLAHAISSGLFIAEVKSANMANFVDQAEQGAIQLLRYEMAIEEDGASVKEKALIIEAAGSSQMVAYVNRLAARVGFTLLQYDASVPWPGRITGLLEMLTGHEPT